jgi:transcriptional regulator
VYLPAHFTENRPEALHDLIALHPLGALVTTGPEGLDANHLPFELDPSAGAQGVLRAHVARNNPLWQELAEGAEVLVIFRAEQGYVSPNWYPSKHETHKQVPTWNYRVVHVRGRLCIRDEESFLRGLVARLTREHEARAQEPRPWKMGDSEPDYIDGLLRSIVGLEVHITQMLGKYKLSQNKEARDRLGMVDGLQANGQLALAAAAQQTLQEP